jgi:hypothetical protein
MSGEIKKICKNCDNLQYGFGESSMNYGPRCSEKDCGVDEDDTCDMFEVSSYLKVKKLQEENKILREALEFYSKTNHWLGLTDKVPFDITKWIRIVEDDMDQNNIGGKRARETLAKIDKQGEG